MKKLVIILTLFILLIVGSVVYVAGQAGGLIRQAVVTHGPELTGSALSLNKVTVSLVGGTASLEGLVINNPKGFKSDHAFRVNQVNISLQMMSLFEEVIRVKEIRIDGADLIYELGTRGNNIAKLQKNVEGNMAKLGLKSSEKETRFIIDDIYINGTKVKLASDLLGGKGAALTLPDLHLENIGTEEKAATGGEVAKRIFTTVNGALSKHVTKDMLDKTLKGVKKKLGDLFK